MHYGFFPGCSYHSAAGYRESVEAVNLKLGIKFTEVNDWNCCGATAILSISQPGSLVLAGRIIALANQMGLKELVTVCNACYVSMRKASEILRSQNELLDEVNRSLAAEELHLENVLPVRHYLDILVNEIPEEVWPHDEFDKFPELNVAAYYGCQFTRPWQDIDRAQKPEMLDRFLKRLGFEVVDHSAGTFCCGAAHALPHTDNCRPLVSRIIGEVVRKGGNTISTICPMCQFNLDAWQDGTDFAPMPITYFTQLAGLALGIDPEALGLGKLLNPMKILSPESHGT